MKLTRRRAVLLAPVLTFALSPAFAATAFSAIDLNEAKAAASKAFDKLDADHSGALSRAELRGRILEQDWKIADPDNHNTLSKAEYLNYVEYAFKRADKDGDGVINAKEARTHAGRVLERLLRAR